MSIGGETEEEKIRMDMLENEVMDLRMFHIRTCYSPDFVSPSRRAGLRPLCARPVCHWTPWSF